MHYANGFLLCPPFLCRDDKRTHELLNEKAAACSFLFIFSTENQLPYWLKSSNIKLRNCIKITLAL